MTRQLQTDAWLVNLPVTTSGAGPSYVVASTDDLPVYNPNFSAGPTGLDPYRPWVEAVLDGLTYIANGYDQNKRWDGASTFYDMGATAPANTTFTLADASTGTAHTSGTTLRYYIAYRNSTVSKESAPELNANGVSGTTHTMSATKDVDISWTDPGGEWDKIAIYRAPQTSDTYHLVAYVDASDEAYTDSTPDSDLRVNLTTWKPRLRLTLPPIFAGLAAYLNRLWGFTANSTNLYYSQAADPAGELLQEDFPDANILPIGPEDGLGEIRAAQGHHDSLFVFKERAAYEVTGDDPAVFTVRRLYSDRGALNRQCIVQAEDIMVILDHRGLYNWMPGAEPLISGATPGTKRSKLQPIWDRLNLSAWSTFHGVHDQRRRVVKFYVALDFEPTPNVRIVYDYANDRFVSVDVAVWGGAAGLLEDSFGAIHEVRGDDLGSVWEEEVGQAEGLTTGATSGTVTSSTLLLLTDSGATFDTTKDGPLGSPYQRGTSSSSPDDTNRAYAVTSTTITPYYCATANASANDTIWLGVIPATARLPKLGFGTHQKKDVIYANLEYDSGHSGTIEVLTAVDDGYYSSKSNVDMTSTVHAVVPCNDKGWTWSVEFSQNAASVGFSLRSMRLRVQQYPDRT